jgi:Leucine-rich repeat (LRR) protein
MDMITKEEFDKSDDKSKFVRLEITEGEGHLDLSGCNNLVYLDFSKTNITSVNMTGLKSLKYLCCPDRMTDEDLPPLKRKEANENDRIL